MIVRNIKEVLSANHKGIRANDITTVPQQILQLFTGYPAADSNKVQTSCHGLQIASSRQQTGIHKGKPVGTRHFFAAVFQPRFLQYVAINNAFFVSEPQFFSFTFADRPVSNSRHDGIVKIV